MTRNIPSQVGEYTLVDVIGVGSFGDVYKVEDTDHGRIVALKLLRDTLMSDPEAVRRFLEEGRRAARINHPNVVKIYDTGLTPDDGTPYIVMEYVNGLSLHQLLEKQPARRLPADEALDILEDVSAGLDVVHRTDLLHRDIKPSNILLTQDGQAKLSDFGLAAARDTSFEGKKSRQYVVGTAGFMAPEVMDRGEHSKQSDIYALGEVLYLMLAGQRRHFGDLPLHQLNSEIPQAVTAVVDRAMAREPGERFVSAGEMAAEFAQALNKKNVLVGESPDSWETAAIAESAQALKKRNVLYSLWAALSQLRAMVRNNRRVTTGGLIGAIVLVVILVVARDSQVVGGRATPVASLSTASPTSVSLVTPIHTLTPTASSTDVPSLTATSSPPETPSATWTSTPTQIPTPTVTPTATPIIASLFDDFSSLDTKTWTRAAGAWRSDGQELLLQNEDSVGLLVVGHHDWNDYEVRVGLRDLTDYPDDKSFGPASIIPLFGRESCSFPSPSSREGYDASFMNGAAVRRTDDNGDPIDWCAPGTWNNRVAIVVGTDPTGPSSGLIVGENWMGWGQLVGTDWSISSTEQFIEGIGSVVGDLRIRVMDNSYEVFLNGEKLPLDFSDQGKPGGKIGIWARSATSKGNGLHQEGDPLTPAFDYLEVTPLNPQPISGSEVQLTSDTLSATSETATTEESRQKGFEKTLIANAPIALTTTLTPTGIETSTSKPIDPGTPAVIDTPTETGILMPTITSVLVQSTDTLMPTVTLAPFATETPAPTMDLTSIRRATNTPTRRPTSTPTRQDTSRPTPTPCTIAVHRDFQAVWTKAGGVSAGCPIGSAYQRRVAYQPFRNGFMLWRAGSATRDVGGMIYVAYNSPRRWQEYYDAWVEGMQEQAGYAPPSLGLREPQRGFGYLWRTELGGPSSDLGWAAGNEEGSDFGLIQDFANGAAIIRFPQRDPVFFPDRMRWVS